MSWLSVGDGGVLVMMVGSTGIVARERWPTSLMRSISTDGILQLLGPEEKLAQLKCGGRAGMRTVVGGKENGRRRVDGGC